jgi:hypothetical protein
MFIILILASFGLNSPSCHSEQEISHNRQPLHSLDFATINYYYPLSSFKIKSWGSNFFATYRDRKKTSKRDVFITSSLALYRTQRLDIYFLLKKRHNDERKIDIFKALRPDKP